MDAIKSMILIISLLYLQRTRIISTEIIPKLGYSIN